jgi:hypothetical protein
MFLFKKYRITDFDNFKPGDFPKVIDELDTLNKRLSKTHEANKADILISFLKKHSLQNEWLIANPELTSLISSGDVAIGNLESLFDSCQANKHFQQQYEDYIRKNLL